MTLALHAEDHGFDPHREYISFCFFPPKIKKYYLRIQRSFYTYTLILKNDQRPQSFKMTRTMLLVCYLVCSVRTSADAGLSVLNRAALFARGKMDFHSTTGVTANIAAANIAGLKTQIHRFAVKPPPQAPRIIGLAHTATVAKSVAGVKHIKNFAVAAPMHAALYAMLQVADLKVLSASGALHALVLGVTLWTTLGLQV